MESKIEGKVENNEPLGEISEDQVLGIMEKIAIAKGSININMQYNEDGQIILWEIKVPIAKGGTKIYTYQKTPNDKGIVMVYFSNNNEKRGITRAEILAEEVADNSWVVRSDEKNIEKE